VLECRRELESVMAWLRAEVEHELRLEALFEDLNGEGE
jgi:hypothetical protein